jgi:hypothetical protein
LIKIIWHDGIGMSLYAKRLEHGRLLWPSPPDGTLAISAVSWPTEARVSGAAAMIAHLKLVIAKLRRHSIRLRGRALGRACWR